jgi:hypothetical protein
MVRERRAHFQFGLGFVRLLVRFALILWSRKQRYE